MDNRAALTGRRVTNNTHYIYMDGPWDRECLGGDDATRHCVMHNSKRQSVSCGRSMPGGWLVKPRGPQTSESMCS
ncbi:hypothetical protein SCLCIDRAFT_1209541 [Scleroderma citrinum Foug A]|uniref:Uncharacterized protein n=1 Tax=Scleroderma citrinum Foug A TaxID=1036808 RepID=A0A0C3A3D1_9AGAM|nr:hypothetical protein SCLCIDRAFT_1209541 [Scleroderma citrinum Foug A]